MGIARIESGLLSGIWQKLKMRKLSCLPLEVEEIMSGISSQFFARPVMSYDRTWKKEALGLIATIQ